MAIKPIKEFLKLEAASGIILLGMLVLALIIANSPLYTFYEHFLDLPIQVRVGQIDINKPIQLWINDGLMAIFFMLLSLEIKRELFEGELSSASQIILPLFAAVGGIAVPVAVFFALAHGQSLDVLRGWAIPTTTDIALALGVIALLGKRVPAGLKVFLVALSIVDDIFAIVLIAVFYSSNLSYLALAFAGMGVAVLAIMNFYQVSRIAAYIMVGVFIWVAVLKSGVHATLAGTIVGLFIPIKLKSTKFSPAKHLEHVLHPWIAFAIMPLFVFVNAGVPLFNTNLTDLLMPLPMGIIFGLFVGKQLGVFAFSWLAIRCRFSKLPTGSSMIQLYGLACITGIGFTMSLFISSLAYTNTPFDIISRQAVLLGSLFSGVLGVLVFIFFSKKKKAIK